MIEKRTRLNVLVVMTWLLVGCGLQPAVPSSPTATPTGLPATATAEPSAVELEQTLSPPLERPREIIAIERPGPGSVSVSPLRVEGVADPTFEQHLSLRLFSMTGELLAEGRAQIEASLGERGPFTGELSFEVDEEGPGLLQVFSSSARDGGLTHLASVVVTLSPTGQDRIERAPVGAEQIIIASPAAGARLTGGSIIVSGVGRASFEGTLVVEVVDAQGQTIGQQPLIVDEPAMGQPGPYRVEVPFNVGTPGPGRVIVYDPSPAFAGMNHLNSVEVELGP